MDIIHSRDGFISSSDEDELDNARETIDRLFLNSIGWPPFPGKALDMMVYFRAHPGVIDEGNARAKEEMTLRGRAQARVHYL